MRCVMLPCSRRRRACQRSPADLPPRRHEADWESLRVPAPECQTTAASGAPQHRCRNVGRAAAPVDAFFSLFSVNSQSLVAGIEPWPLQELHSQGSANAHSPHQANLTHPVLQAHHSVAYCCSAVAAVSGVGTDGSTSQLGGLQPTTPWLMPSMGPLNVAQ